MNDPAVHIPAIRDCDLSQIDAEHLCRLWSHFCPLTDKSHDVAVTDAESQSRNDQSPAGRESQLPPQ
jgi:hypothetical protein